MKKFTTLAVLPLIALASCSKNEEITSITPTTTEASPVSAKSNIENQNNEILNENISIGTTDESGVTVKEFNLTYDLPDGKPLEFNGNIEVENGIIKSINFPKYDLENAQTYEVKFAKKMQSDLIGKELKGLQYDGMSGASLTTDSFNEYLNTINK